MVSRRYTALFLALAIMLVFAACSTNTEEKQTTTSTTTTTTTLPPTEPALATESLIQKLDHPWDIAFLPDDTMLFTERSGALNAFIDSQVILLANIDDVKNEGEGGLMGLGVDKQFSINRYIYTCFNSRSANDVRIVRHTLNKEVTALEESTAIVTGLPSNDSGRHSGCRIGVASDGTLFVGTGDAAKTSVPQDPKSLGGKILHVDRNGQAVKGNLSDPFDPRILNYGHRNVQGIALFDKAEDGIYGLSVEHGSDRDDEINLITTGNFGWSPTGDYDESVPMTDTKRFPDAQSAIWSSGEPTIAPSGITFLSGAPWGTYNGCVAMAVLKDERVKILCFDDAWTITFEKDVLSDFGRVRAVIQGPDGNLYIATDKDEGEIIRVTPSTH